MGSTGSPRPDLCFPRNKERDNEGTAAGHRRDVLRSAGSATGTQWMLEISKRKAGEEVGLGFSRGHFRDREARLGRARIR
jgi:hypothetical protein